MCCVRTCVCRRVIALQTCIVLYTYTVELYVYVYSGTKDTTEKTSVIRTKILVPTGVTNAFLIRGNLYIAAKNG